MLSPAALETRTMPQLDSVRAIAVLIVCFAHFIPYEPLSFFHTGRLGVLLFFMLSGFLITGILLRERRFKDENAAPGGPHLRIFYLRRSLRIFPIYYLTLFIMALLHYAPVRDHLIFHLTYTANLVPLFKNINFESASHFWSLCVEEQFYLVWPFVILYMPRKFLPAVIIGLILAGPFAKFFASLSGLRWGTVTRTPFGCMDSLALGSLLAYCRDARLQKAEDLLKKYSAFAGIPLYLALQIYREVSDLRLEPPVYIALFDLGVCLTFLPLLIRAGTGIKGPAGQILDSPALRFIGKISYGIYVYHLLLIPVLDWLAAQTGITLPPPGFSLVLLHLSAAIGAASLSWFLIEAPLNGLKRFIPFPGDAR